MYREELEVLLQKFGSQQIRKKKFKVSSSGHRIPEVVEQAADIDAVAIRSEWTGFKFHMYWYEY